MDEKIIPPTNTQTASVSYVAPALEKGFNVIELLAKTPRGLTISEIAAGLGLSMGEIFRIIMVMERRRWLRKEDGDKYRVTPLVLDLAFKATPAEELAAVATPFMKAFAHATDQSCHLVIRNNRKGLVVMRYQNPGPTGFHVRIGSEIDLETTCSGHVLLAFDPSENSVADASQPMDPRLKALLNAVRQRGYERMESARTLGVTDISYPIFDFHGGIAAALTVPFLKMIDGSQIVQMDRAQELLSEAAKHITLEISGKE